MAEDRTEFSGIRSFLWPIYRHELFKFVPLMVIFFLISINYHLFRIAKDALIITAPNSGAEVLPFLKVWVTLPSAILEAFIYTRLVNKFSKEKAFYIIVGAMLFFLLCFILFIYPHKETLYLDHFAESLQKVLPAGCKGFVAIYRYWMFSLFYVIAESWSFLVLSVLLWGFANDVTSVKEAGRFYALFGIGINSSGIVVGELANVLSSSSREALPAFVRVLGGKTAFDYTLIVFTGIILFCGVLAIVLYRWMHVKVLVTQPKQTNVVEEKKPRLSIRENIAYVMKSKYLICIAVILLSYHMVFNLTEVLWKSQLKELFPNPQQYTAYTSRVVFFIGILATLSSIFVSGNLIRRSGWKVAALATPLIVLTTGLCFFYFLFEQRWGGKSLILLGVAPLALSVFFGSLQNILTRTAKYTVFDDTKEMAFIPLSEESRMKGKASIDGIGSRLGKSGSSLFMQILLIFYSTIIEASPVICLIFLLAIPAWIFSINILDKKFRVLTTEPTPASLEEKALS